jgi:hypothetical protein
MRAWVLGVMLVIVCTAPLAADGFTNCYTRVTPDSDNFIVTVIGRCSWTVAGTVYKSVTLAGDMTISPTGTRAACYGDGYCGMSAKPPYTASTTYTSTATFKASQLYMPIDEITVTDSATTPDPIRPHTTCPSCCEVSPIVISLRGDYRLTSVADGVSFDIDADGVAERMSWTAGGSEVAFLALDRNGNGRIDDGAELFGDAIAADGWIALAQLDANGDGVIDANDAEWRNLLLWYDRDHDGRSSSAELVSVASTEIAAIGTGYRWSGRRDAFGNMFRYAGEVTLASGRREAYDVYFLAAK